MAVAGWVGSLGKGCALAQRVVSTPRPEWEIAGLETCGATTAMSRQCLWHWDHLRRSTATPPRDF